MATIKNIDMAMLSQSYYLLGDFGLI